MKKTLWITQGLLAALFLFAGLTKLWIPTDVLAAQAHMSGLFLKFIGVAETLGAIGLVLPGLLRIAPALTPTAAIGLTIIMTGAVVVTVSGGTIAAAAFPAIVGLLTASVAYGRSRELLHAIAR